MAKPQPLATPEDVAEWLQVTVAYLAKLRHAKKGPRWTKVGRSVRYAWGDVHRWCTENADGGGGAQRG
ncbi:DNA-binding protein [Microbacteriaceae bacterium VKM Ac-2854]|nr:DNA-binding protein [Microbacteriaceae bacterium VKM Ac-2854]